MRAWAIDRYGDSSAVNLMTVPEPKVSEDEVLIQVKAASINPVDFKIRDGQLRFVLPYKFPLKLGNDCSGIVVKKGARATRFNAGDEVYTRPHKERIGTLAEFIAVKETAVALKPKNTTFEEAASLPLVGLTSWQAIIELAQLKRGDRVFIPAGSGGVGTFAIQLAKHFGAHVITNTSTKNIDFVKSLGANEAIDYTQQEFSSVITDIDIVFDTMGGETQKKAFSVLKRGGVLVSIIGPPTVAFAREAGLGLPGLVAAFLLSFPTIRRASTRGASYEFLFMHPDGTALQKIAGLVESGAIRPVLDRVYPFEEAKDALHYVESGRARGKVVVTLEAV